MEDLKFDYEVSYDEKDAVGRRYRRQDALGTPYCITIDHQTIEDQTVTIRDRNTMKQERMLIKELGGFLHEKLNFKNWLKKIQ
jgi:glycyl-tRNA synthetase